MRQVPTHDNSRCAKALNWRRGLANASRGRSVMDIAKLATAVTRSVAGEGGFRTMRRLLLSLIASAGAFTIAQNGALAQAASTPPSLQLNQGFFERLVQAYADEFKPAPSSAEAGAAATRRPPPFPPAPLASPPWSWPDWPFGGTPLIGGATPNSSGGNLMKALHGTSLGDFLNDNHIEIYGWAEGGMNLSTSHGKFGNLPAAYDYTPNLPMLNQAVVYVERVPDTVQQDHIDWGFRVIGVYGTDWRFLGMDGVFAEQLIKRDAQYGYDLPSFYGDIYIPWIGQGTDIRIGRYMTLPDIEADLALQNVFYSHSMYYTYDPFTQFGIVWSTRLTKNWVAQIGINAGSDNAPWTHSAKPTVTGCVQWNSDSSSDNVYVCANGTNDGRYAYNNVQLYVFTWYHKFTDRLWVGTEDYYEYERKVPNVSTNAGALIRGANGALCGSGNYCWAGAYALSFYVMYQLTDKDYVGLRNEGYYDARGQRTGFKTWYSENTLGWARWLSNSIAVRPEVRFDHAYDATPYSNGKARSQFTAAADLFIKF
jgi:hypothetical protein